MNDKDEKKKSPRKFDTTTRLNLNDTFGEDEVTQKDEIPEPEEDDGDSVTQRLGKKGDDEDSSLVSAKFKNIVRGQGRVAAAVKNMGKMAKRCWGLCCEFGREAWQDKTKRWWALAALAVIALVVVSAVVFLPTRTARVTPAGVSVPAQGTPLQVTPIEFFAADGKAIDPNAIRAGSSIFLNFHVLKWDAGREEKLGFAADLRLYSGTGKLVLYKPRFAGFSGTADIEKDKILIKTRLDLSRDLPLGFYRAVIQVTEVGTGRKAHQQGRFKVIP